MAEWFIKGYRCALYNCFAKPFQSVLPVIIQHDWIASGTYMSLTMYTFYFNDRTNSSNRQVLNINPACASLGSTSCVDCHRLVGDRRKSVSCWCMVIWWCSSPPRGRRRRKYICHTCHFSRNSWPCSNLEERVCFAIWLRWAFDETCRGTCTADWF